MLNYAPFCKSGHICILMKIEDGNTQSIYDTPG